MYHFKYLSKGLVVPYEEDVLNSQVFADHESSLHPFQVQRSEIWNLQRRFVYFGSSITNISKGSYAMKYLYVVIIMCMLNHL